MANNQFSNNAATNLASGITNSATSLTVTTGQGALFPVLTGSQYFYATLANAAGTAIEIVKVTARVTDTFTIVRAQDGTAALPWSSGDKFELRVTRAVLNNFGQLDSSNTWSGQNNFTDNTSTFAGTAASAILSDDTNNLAGLPASSYALLNSPNFTGNPTAPTPSSGDSDTSIATTAFVTTAISNNPSLGVGQTWQNVTSTRSASTIFQNTSGRPIEVAIKGSGVTGPNIEVSLNGSTNWIIVGFMSSAATTGNQFIVPANWYYRINGSVNAGFSWSELRS